MSSPENLPTNGQALRPADSRLRIMIDMIPTHAWSARSDGTVDFVNRRILEYTGLSERESMDFGWLPAIHPEDADSVLNEWGRVLASGKGGETEARLRRFDGEYRWFLFRAQPFRDDDGEIIGWFGTNTDIQDLKNAERELRDVTDNTPMHMGFRAPDGQSLYANRFGLDYAGFTLEEYQAARWEDYVHPEDMDRLMKADILRDTNYEFEVRLKRKDGVFRWHLFRTFPTRDSAGRILRWYFAGTDIEDRKRDEERVQNENLVLREEIDSISMFEEIVGNSDALQTVLAGVAKVAPTETTVLITGETGTGKELIARAIHKRSSRSQGAFVAVNCAAIPQSLIASELFGHEKGAFTGALQRRPGRFEAAAGGTIFLDEVGELPMETQIALLRVLQEHEFERVGGERPIKTDVRVIAATNRDLTAAVAEGTFRADLFYRLNVFPIAMPPLRERRQDIPMLVKYLIDRYGSVAGKKISNINKPSMAFLQSYSWPGNVRELQNVIERSVILCESETLSIDPSWLASNQIGNEQSRPGLEFASDSLPMAESLAHRERAMIEAALADTRGRISGPAGAAARLGMKPSTLESRIKSFKIDKYAFKRISGGSDYVGSDSNARGSHFSANSRTFATFGSGYKF